MGEILTELSQGVVELVGTLPEYATAIKEFGENLIFTNGEGGEKTVSAVFGWLVLGGVVTIGISAVKALTRRISGAK